MIRPRLLFPLLSLCLLLVAPAPVRAEEPASAFEAMVGEELTYDIAFLWFDRIAEGRLSLERMEEAGSYRAVLEAKTLGIAAWLTRDRVQRYVSIMEATPEGRLRSRVHESHVVKGKGKKRTDRFKRYLFDHEKGRVAYQRARRGRFGEEKFYPMEGPEPPNDILTAFYNLRAGVFGPLRPGGRYLIPTFNRRGKAEIKVEILTDEEREELPAFRPGGLLARAILDEEIFDTSGGWIYVRFDEGGRPAEGIVENVIGLGNVRGTMRK